MSSGDKQADEWNCTSYPALVANPDIGGIGTILTFVISVYLTLICCVAKARIDHIRSPDKDTPKLDLWSFALGNVILNFCDQQVVLGIAVLIAGVSQLSSGLDSYHWQTVLNLAWFSSFTHILTLTALRAENRSNNKIKVIRVVAMGVLAVILMCMVYTAGWVSGKVVKVSSEDSKNSPPMSFPAWCLFRPEIPWMWQNHLLDIQYNWTYVVLAFLILVFSYSTRALLLYFESIGQVMTLVAKFLWFDKLAGLFGITNMKSIGSRLNGMGRRKWSYRLLRSLYAISLACRQTFDSTIWELGWLSFALVWGTVRIFTVRELPNSQDNLDSSESMSAILSEENDWGFGQVLGLSLMILPLLKAYSSPPDAMSLRKKSSTDAHTSPDTSSDYDVLPSSIDLSQTYTSTSINIQKSQVRIEIENEVWFKKLICIIYLLSVITGGITIFVGLFEPPSFLGLGIIIVYVEWIFVDLFVLWLVTLIFVDHDIQRFWTKSWMGKVTNKMRWFWWCLFVLFLITFCFVAWLGSIFVLVKGLEIITHKG
ncbi:uncharacterized protein EAE98_010282 [Botrytis deweyae]|uniref:Amino acid transporter transmembrane domain-containing protein n=1 Tax=Botrytis deweyae TaxID=2478750 RepID=A0ABQ7I903_9HELO|nr:uncharacterized protein EAE98_010282 [Botrytis deweyae]KAF7917177.1 hypothetical protein EAE98_010282 [Botrytis deweyae]